MAIIRSPLHFIYDLRITVCKLTLIYNKSFYYIFTQFSISFLEFLFSDTLFDELGHENLVLIAYSKV